jgi:hypothetical protein
MTQQLTNKDVFMRPMNNRRYEQGRKRHSCGRTGRVFRILMARMMVFAFLLFMLCCGVAFAATWGPTSITDTSGDRYKAEGYSRW